MTDIIPVGVDSPTPNQCAAHVAAGGLVYHQNEINARWLPMYLPADDWAECPDPDEPRHGLRLGPVPTTTYVDVSEALLKGLPVVNTRCSPTAAERLERRPGEPDVMPTWKLMLVGHTRERGRDEEWTVEIGDAHRVLVVMPEVSLTTEPEEPAP